MLHLFPSPRTTEPNYPYSMDLHESPTSTQFLVSWHATSTLFSSQRYIRNRAPPRKLYRFKFYTGAPTPPARLPVACTRRGDSARHFDCVKQSCEVVWILEADLDPGQALYLTGDPTILGCWEPDMAILMSPVQNSNFWTAKVKIATGVNFRYNYFVETERGSSCDIIWRPGPQFSLLVPSSLKQDGKIMVRDSWTMSAMEREASLWGSWLEENSIPPEPINSPSDMDDKRHIETSFKAEISHSEVKHISDVYKELGTIAATDNGNQITLLSEIDQPVEEPWLIQPFSRLFKNMQDELAEGIEPLEVTVRTSDPSAESHSRGLLPEEGIFSVKAESVSTMILINSSICTMQRIAVLEDETLVELLLEPVKSNVQCDSVYLGVVTKMVPHMGGAFVNIGSSRHSFMDIKPFRKPFIFPPFHEVEKQDNNASVVQNLEESPQTNYGMEHITHCLDDPGKFVHEDYEEHEMDELDVSDALDGDPSLVAAGYDKVETCVQDHTNGWERHTESKAINGSFPLDMENLKISEMSNVTGLKDSSPAFINQKGWSHVRKGTKIVVQVVKEGLGTKGPTMTAYPRLKSRFWILTSSCERIGVSKKISGVERTRLRVIAKTLQPKGFGLTVRTVAAGRSLEELQKDLDGLLSTWKNIVEDAKSAALAADEGIEGAIPVLLHRATGQTLSVVQDYFNDKVKKMVVDSPRTYHEVTNYLQEIAPDLCDRVELYDKRIPLFDLYNIEAEINNMLTKRVPLPNGGSLVIEQTEALVSVDVNGGHGMFGEGASQEKAILDVNLVAARQIAREIRLRDIGGIIVVDFIDMSDESNKRLVYEEIKKAAERDRSLVKVSELSRHGLMEITRKRVRPSVTFMISEPCFCCHGTGRVEALETSFSKIEQEICRLLAKMERKADPEDPKSWPRLILMVDNHMSNYLTAGKRTRLAVLSSSLKVWILLKVARHFTRGTFEVKHYTEETSSQRQHQAAISLLRKVETSSEDASKKVTLIPIKKGKASGKRT